MEIMRLPAAQQELQVGAAILRRSRRVFGIDPIDMADRLDTELARSPLPVDRSDHFDVVDAAFTDHLMHGGLDPVQLLQMESGELPPPRRLTVATLALVDDRLAALEALIDDMREVGDSPFADHQLSGTKAG